MVVKLLAVGVAAVVGTAAMAAEGGLSVQVNHDVLTYSSASTKTEMGGASVTSKNTAIQTYNGDLSVVLGFQNWTLYLFPGQGGTPLRAGYMVMPELEVGLNLALNSSSNDDKASSPAVKTDIAKNTYGLYGTYFLNLGKPSLEIGLAIDSETSNTKTVTTTEGVAGAAVEEKLSGMSYGLTVDYILPVAGGFSYVAGLGYEMSNMKESESDTKMTTSTLMVKLAGARLDF